MYVISSSQIKVSTACLGPAGGTSLTYVWSRRDRREPRQNSALYHPPLYIVYSLFTWQTARYLADPPHHPADIFLLCGSHCEGFISKIRPGRLQRSTWDSSFFVHCYAKRWSQCRVNFRARFVFRGFKSCSFCVSAQWGMIWDILKENIFIHYSNVLKWDDWFCNEGAVPIINLPHQPYSASKLCASKRDFERIPIAL